MGLSNLRVGFLSTQNYLARYAFSGTLFSMYQALQRRELEIVPLGEPRSPSLWQKALDYGKKAQTTLKLKSTDPDAELQQILSKIQRQLDQKGCDVIFAPVAGREVIHLNFQSPVVFLSDATAEMLNEYYHQWFSNTTEFEEANQSERAVISKADRIVYPSQQAAESAINHYKADPAKVTVIPFGANLTSILTAEEVLSRRKPLASNTPCKLIFVGRNAWHRKGGDIAFETLLALCGKGIDAELWIVGSVPPDGIQHSRLHVIPHLNKNDPKQQNQFNELLLQSNFFLFPTRGDCSPIVISEANAFGLPVLTTDVGGIPTIIKNGRNGYMLSRSASGQDFANLIAELLSDRDRYEQLVQASRHEYDQRLNWDKWAESIHQIFSLAVDPS